MAAELCGSRKTVQETLETQQHKLNPLPPQTLHTSFLFIVVSQPPLPTYPKVLVDPALPNPGSTIHDKNRQANLEECAFSAKLSHSVEADSGKTLALHQTSRPQHVNMRVRTSDQWISALFSFLVHWATVKRADPTSCPKKPRNRGQARTGPRSQNFQGLMQSCIFEEGQHVYETFSQVDVTLPEQTKSRGYTTSTCTQFALFINSKARKQTIPCLR